MKMITAEKEFGNGFDDGNADIMKLRLIGMTFAKTEKKNSANVSDVVAKKYIKTSSPAEKSEIYRFTLRMQSYQPARTKNDRE